MYAQTHTHTHICTHSLCTYTNVHTYTYIHTYKYIQKQAHSSTYTFTYKHVHTLVHMQSHVQYVFCPKLFQFWNQRPIHKKAVQFLNLEKNFVTLPQTRPKTLNSNIFSRSWMGQLVLELGNVVVQFLNWTKYLIGTEYMHAFTVTCTHNHIHIYKTRTN